MVVDIVDMKGRRQYRRATVELGIVEERDPPTSTATGAGRQFVRVARIAMMEWVSRS